MSLCKRLHVAKDDEANAVLEYVKLKDLLPSDHVEHINVIGDIITDEGRHLQEILLIIKEMGCEDISDTDKLCIALGDAKKNIDEVEKLSAYIGNRDRDSDGKRIHDIVEEVEKKLVEIRIIVDGVKKEGK